MPVHSVNTVYKNVNVLKNQTIKQKSKNMLDIFQQEDIMSSIKTLYETDQPNDHNKIIEEEYEPTSQQIDTLKKQRENKINVNLFSPLNLDYYIKDQEQLALNALKFKKPKNRVENTYQPQMNPKPNSKILKTSPIFWITPKLTKIMKI